MPEQLKTIALYAADLAVLSIIMIGLPLGATWGYYFFTGTYLEF